MLVFGFVGCVPPRVFKLKQDARLIILKDNPVVYTVAESKRTKETKTLPLKANDTLKLDGILPFESDLPTEYYFTFNNQQFCGLFPEIISVKDIRKKSLIGSVKFPIEKERQVWSEIRERLESRLVNIIRSDDFVLETTKPIFKLGVTNRDFGYKITKRVTDKEVIINVSCSSGAHVTVQDILDNEAEFLYPIVYGYTE